MARERIARRAAAGSIAVAAVGTVTWWLVSPTNATGPHDPAAATAPVRVVGTTSASGSSSAAPNSSPSSSVSPSRSAGATATPKRAKATPAASKNTAAAATIALPPPPHNPGTAPTSSPPATTTASPTGSVAATATCPAYDGTDAAKSAVATALSGAAATPRAFTYTDASGASHTVSITVPDVLIKAIAWQESGWQSQIVACDGGYGTMQIMSGTATWMNNRFATAYDYHTLAGNTQGHRRI
jgi:soluble lytic murein transglycosylase-like protein